jgi:poly-gamma-glutamate synthase PgsB/CapB
LRIAVTGTRGKSGVTRLIAAGLRESGAGVMAKTTGARPALILPDGTEEEIPRPGGNPSIREQVRVVGRAAAMKADVLVAEMMSIGGEYLFTESRRIVRPGILALTNVRLDHLDAMGAAKEDVARTLTAAFPEGAVIFIPNEESCPIFEEAAGRLHSRIESVMGRVSEDQGLTFEKFEPNVRLALAVLESLGVDRDIALRGMSRALPDFGSLRLWKAEFGTPPRSAYCVSAFAANDPESSAAVLERIKGMLPAGSRSLIGLLCLREDRGDRTLQWVRAAGEGFFSGFSSVLLIGPPARAALRQIRRRPGPGGPVFSAIERGSPGDLMTRALAAAPGEVVVVGLGNFVGPGAKIVRHWELGGSAHVG